MVLYDFIFFFFFKLCERIKTVDPRDNAMTLTGLTIFFHIFFTLSIIAFITDVNMLASVFGKDHSKYFWLPFVLVFMIFIYRFFKRRADIILSKYGDKKVLTLLNVFIVIGIMMGPFLLGIYLLNYR
jgi:hypothetical protein